MTDTSQVVPPAALIDHPNPAPTVNASIWTMLAIATIFLALRLYCKTFHNRWMMWLDDYLLLAGWIVNVTSHVLTTKMLAAGFGQSLNVTPTISTFIYTADNCHKIALALTKTSFAVTLLRISTGWQVWVVWFLVISMNIQFVVHIVLTWRRTCGAPEDETPHLPVSCWATESAIALGLFGGFYSAISDFVLALLPWKIIMGLNMKRREKIGVATAMSIGVLAGITGIMKAVWSIILFDFMRPDYPWHMAIFWIWCQAEPNATIIAASIPSFRVFLKKFKTSSDRTYPINQYIKSDNFSKFHNNDTAVRAEAVSQAADAHSDHSVAPLSSNARGKPGGITRTREVELHYDTRERGSENDGDEMELTPRWPL